MPMFVDITNLTDGPGKSPTQIDVYNKTLNPGAFLQLPAAMVNEKLRRLERTGLISIGDLPEWYRIAKNSRNRSLTLQEQQQLTVIPPPPVVTSEPPQEPEKQDEGHGFRRKQRG